MFYFEMQMDKFRKKIIEEKKENYFDLNCKEKNGKIMKKKFF
jgi:hypothetical protein